MTAKNSELTMLDKVDGDMDDDERSRILEESSRREADGRGQPEEQSKKKKKSRWGGRVDAVVYVDGSAVRKRMSNFVA